MAAWFWIIAWALWWLIASLGVQGTTPVVGLIGFLAVPVLFRKRPALSYDVIAFGLFMLWCITTSFWSEGADEGIVTLDFATGNLAIEAPGFRLALISLVCGFAYWSLHQLEPKMYARARIAARVGLGIMAAIVVVGTVAYGQVALLGETISDKQNVMQNFIRTANVCVLSIPLLLAMYSVRRLVFAVPLGAAALAIMLYVAQMIDAQAAVLAVLAVAGICCLTQLAGRWTYRILGYLSATLIMTMPLIIGGVLSMVEAGDRSKLPLSFVSRLESYQYVLNRIHQKWIMGWGVEASRGWKDTVDVEAFGKVVQYRIVPGHPHNMGLHVWAETGLIGAFLLSVFIILLGERLYRTGSRDKAVIASAAAIWAGALIYATFSYSLWNDAFWVGILFLASGVLIVSRTSKKA